MATILKYNRNKRQFNLNYSNTHFVYRKTRKEEVIEMDKWLVAETDKSKKATITFADENGKLHKDVEIDTENLSTWYNDPLHDNYGDWRSFMWEIPTTLGTICIFVDKCKCYLNDKIINSSKILIKA